MAGATNGEHSQRPRSDDQGQKLNFVAPRRNIRLPGFSKPWTYTKSIITLMEKYEAILEFDESLALYMKKTLEAHRLEDTLQQELGRLFPRVIEYQNRNGEQCLPPAWTHVLSDATPDQFEDQGNRTYHRCIDSVVVEIPEAAFDVLETFRDQIGLQPTPDDLRQEAKVVSDVSGQLAELAKVLAETREHVLRVQDKFQTRSDTIRRHLGEDQPQSVSNTSQEEKRQDMNTAHSHSSQNHHQSSPAMSREEDQERESMGTAHSHPSQCHYQSLSTTSLEKNQEQWQIEAVRDPLLHSQPQAPSNTSQETGQGQRPIEASSERPGETQLPFIPQTERENSILSSQGGDIPYGGPERDRASPAALEETGGHPTQFDDPVSQKHTLSTAQYIPTERDDIDMPDDSSDSMEASDARSTTTPNTEIMQDVRPTTSSKRPPVPDSQRTGLEHLPVATTGQTVTPSPDERENGYYFIESLKLHGTSWKEIARLYAHRFGVVRSVGGLIQHWLRWRAQGRKLVILKYRRDQQPTGTTGA